MSNEILPDCQGLHDGRSRQVRHDGCELITRPLIETRLGPQGIPEPGDNEKILVSGENGDNIDSPGKGRDDLGLGLSPSLVESKEKTITGHNLSDNPASSQSSTYEEHDDGHGLAILLRACELLDAGPKKEAKSPRKHVADRCVRSPNKTPRSSRSCSPSKSRHEKPHGPCMNPYCLNPHESPQWRKGPSECPVLCNACGTRWIRNRSLVPLVPKRGIRYSKGKPRSPKKADTKDVDQAILNKVTMVESERIEITAS